MGSLGCSVLDLRGDARGVDPNPSLGKTLCLLWDHVEQAAPCSRVSFSLLSQSPPSHPPPRTTLPGRLCPRGSQVPRGLWGHLLLLPQSSHAPLCVCGGPSQGPEAPSTPLWVAQSPSLEMGGRVGLLRAEALITHLQVPALPPLSVGEVLPGKGSTWSPIPHQGESHSTRRPRAGAPLW